MFHSTDSSLSAAVLAAKSVAYGDALSGGVVGAHAEFMIQPKVPLSCERS